MKHIVVIPFNVPWNWSTDYTNQTAFELAKNGNTVICYLWGDAKSLKELALAGKYPRLVIKYSKNIYLVNPIYFIPFRRFKLIADLNSTINLYFLRFLTELLAFIKKAKNKIFWIFNPNLIYLYKYFGRKYFLLYDCVDFFAVDDKEYIKRTKINERYLCKRADLVVANSHVLQNHLFQYRKNVRLVPQGFRISDFLGQKPKINKLDLSKPIIGFVGGINTRLDFNLLIPLIKNNPYWSFVVWGSRQDNVEINELTALPNVKTGQSKNKNEIPGIISQFDIGMIPYDISQNFNKYCYPMKLFEYFYLGKPIISTQIEELKRFPKFVKIGRNYKDWEKIILDLLSKRWPENKKVLQKKLAIENSWENKVKFICQFIK